VITASVAGTCASRSSVARRGLWLTNLRPFGNGIAVPCHLIAPVVWKSSRWRRGRLRERGLSELSTDRFGQRQVPRPAYTSAYLSSHTDVYNQQKEVS